MPYGLNDSAVWTTLRDFLVLPADASCRVTMQSRSKTIHLRTRLFRYHDDNMAANFV